MLLSRRFAALTSTALLVGLVAGFAAVAFRYVISGVENFAFTGNLAATAREENNFIQTEWGYLVFMVPALGGAVIGAIRWVVPEMRRQGISEVLAAVQARGGILRGRSSWGHAAISAITVGTGGSTGREGPIAYIGAALGSSFGRRLGFRARDIKVLLGAGTAAGIAATFNAPLGGVLFALELILPEFTAHAFIPVVIATVIGVTVAQFFFGDAPTFIVPEFTLVSPWELVAYMLLGVACGLGGVFFIKTMTWARDAGDRARLPDWALPATGGLVVGLLGLGIFEVTRRYGLLGGEGNYHIFGTGYGTVSAILTGEPFMLLVPLLVLLAVAKPLASAATIGSGGGGGILSSSLFQGALYGAIVGIAVNAFAPIPTAPVSAYALVGMGAFYAATGRATLTTIVLLSELTRGYTIVLPLMFAAVTADAVSIGLSKDSIYTIPLRRKGIVYEHGRVQNPLDTIGVEDCMSRKVDCLRSDRSVAAAFSEMMNMGHQGFPVLDPGGRLVGLVTRREVAKALENDRGNDTLADILSGRMIIVRPQEMLHEARDRMYNEDVGRVMVVDAEHPRQLVGILTRSDLLRAEAEHDVEHSDMWSKPPPRRKSS